MKVLVEKDPGFAVNTEQAKFTLAENSALFDILCNKIYSNKIRAVVRELTCNAIDSHVEAGQTRRVEIRFPERNGDEFYIQDFGTGLSKDQCLKLYVTYGMSTKTETNNAVGFMGIGSKSFWSVTNMATVTSVKDGLRHVLVCSKDKEGNQVINCMSGQGIETDEPNGVKISFIVNSEASRYREEALSVFKNFHEKNLPYDIVKSQVFTLPKENWNFEEEQNYKYEVVDSYYGSSGIEAVMGGVTYPVDDYHVKSDILGRKYKAVLFFDIGQLSVNAGRESLKYTEETVQNINNKLRQVFESICKKLEKDIKSLKTNIDKLIYINNSGSLTHFTQKIKFDQKHLGYDQILTESKDLIKEDDNAKILSESFYGTVNKYTLEKTSAYNKLENNLVNILRSLRDKNKLALVLKDEANYYAKINHNMQDPKYIIVFEDEPTIKKFASYLGISYEKISNMSDPPKGSPSASSAKTSKIFKFSSNANAKFSSTHHSTYWEEVDYDLDNGGFYVEINRYLINGTEDPENLALIVGLYNLINKTPFNKDIFGIKTKYIKKLGSTKKPWIDVFDFLKKECEDTMQKCNLFREHFAYQKLSHLLNNNRFYRSYCEEFPEYIKTIVSLDPNHFDSTHHMSRLLSKFDQDLDDAKNYKQKYTIHNSVINKFINKYCAAKKDAYKLRYKSDEDVILSKYPMLRFLVSLNLDKDKKDEYETFLDYIKSIDGIKKSKNSFSQNNQKKVGV